MTKKLRRTKKGCNGVIKDTKGNKISSEQEKKERWKGHFSFVLNCEESIFTHDFELQQRELQVDDGPIRAEGVAEALAKKKSNKSRGQDLITAEIIKAL